MTRYEEMWETGAAKKAVRINWDPKDKDLLDSDSVTFKSIDDLDIGENILYRIRDRTSYRSLKSCGYHMRTFSEKSIYGYLIPAVFQG